jgi:hypothetical protein
MDKTREAGMLAKGNRGTLVGRVVKKPATLAEQGG